MRVEKAKLARRLGLPANADESTIRARMAGLDAQDHIRAAAPAPRSAPVLDVAARARVSTDVELRALAGSVQTTADRAAVAEELSHRQAMATHYPGLRRSDGPRVRHFS